jgi:hypothetical protein
MELYDTARQPFKLRVLPVIIKPDEIWLSDEEPVEGYWGSIRTKSDYERAKARILAILEEITSGLSKGGYGVELQQPIEIWDGEDVMSLRDKFDANVGIVLTMGRRRDARTAGLLPQFPETHLFAALNVLLKYLILYDEFEPDLYTGVFHGMTGYRSLLDRGLADRIIPVEGSLEKLKSAIRVIYALEKVAHSRLLYVGGPASYAGGWATLLAGSRKFGFSVDFRTHGQLMRDYEEMRGKSADEAMRLGGKFAANAERVVEADEERLLRGGIYQLVLQDYLRESGTDWVAVDCRVGGAVGGLGQLPATPCMAFMNFNDSGIVATCEGDPNATVIQYLLRYIANRPVFLANPNFNEGRSTVIMGHCTAPSRLLGFDQRPFRYLARTHHESGKAAAPQVLFEPGVVTIVAASFDFRSLMAIRGEVVRNTDYEICRSQVEVKVNDVSKLIEKRQGFHWLMVYGDYLREMELLAKLTGMELITG